MLRSIRRIVIRAAVVTLIVLGVYLGFSFLNRSEPVPEDSRILDETVVEEGEITVTVSGTGVIAPVRQVPLTFEVSAPITEILIEEGEPVEAGQVIARVDTTDFDAALVEAEIAVQFQQLNMNALNAPAREVDIAAAEAAVAAAQAAYNAAYATRPTTNDVEIARLRTELARNQLWQAQLQADGFDTQTIQLPDDVPPEIRDAIIDILSGLNTQTRDQAMPGLIQLEYGIDIARTNEQAVQQRGPDLGSLNSANAGRTQAQIALDRLLNGPDSSEVSFAQIDLEQAELALRQAESNRRRAELVAPFDGVLARNNLILGQIPPSNGPAALLIDSSEFIVDLPIDETDIVQVEVGQPVTLTFDALPGEEVSGQVTQVSVTPTRIGELVTYRVQVTLDPTEEPVRVGMTATARIATQQVDDVLLLRNRFIRIDRATQGAFVTVVRPNGRLEEVPVVLGVRNDAVSEIVFGLEANQRVVLAPRTTNILGN
jgi:HlyD family secretion protein